MWKDNLKLNFPYLRLLSLDVSIVCAAITVSPNSLELNTRWVPEPFWERVGKRKSEYFCYRLNPTCPLYTDIFYESKAAKTCYRRQYYIKTQCLQDQNLHATYMW
jgi:hypothetical protein